ncbi:hypothetical protein C2S51_036800 [Perilla frutescens var. frutescens]|nr:hypothetical protein C2S51_036800 [Perilla frutescens var. frutescens]
MKEMEIKNLKGVGELLASQPLKKTLTKLLISISIFSLLFSCSFSSSTLLYYQNLHYFSTNTFHLKSIAMNKNSIFLICNGILVFLAKTSDFVRPPSVSDLDEMLQKRIGDGLQVEREAEALSDKHIIVLDKSGLSTDNDDEDDQETKAHEAEEINEAIGVEEMEVDQELEHSNERGDEVSISAENEPQKWRLFDDQDQEELCGGEEVDEIEKLSTEELNKKFEDFIRKMKEEFRVNEYQYQQQQLVAVK